MTRAHEAWRFTAPVWAYGMGSTVWVIFGLYQRQLGLRPEIRLWTAIVVSVSFLAHVPYTDMGQPIEGLLVAGGIAFGELLGLTLEAQRPSRRPMSFMFGKATSFNQPLNDWNVSNVRRMYDMFEEATSFNHAIHAPWFVVESVIPYWYEE